MELKKKAYGVVERLGIETKRELDSVEVLKRLYVDIRKEGDVKAEIDYTHEKTGGEDYSRLVPIFNGKKVPVAKDYSKERMVLELASSDDGARIDQCLLIANKAAIINSNGVDISLVFGSTNLNWSHLGGAEVALMFGAMDWVGCAEGTHRFKHEGIQSKEELAKLSYDQVGAIIVWHGGLSRLSLIGSYRDELFIRNGYDWENFHFTRDKLPEEMLLTTKVSGAGRKFFYKRELVGYLRDYISKRVEKQVENRKIKEVS